MSNQPEPQIRDALRRFGDPASTVEERRAALSALLDSRKFKTLLGTAEVLSGMDIWSAVASDLASPDLDRLTAVAELTRMSMSAPALVPRVDKILSGALESQLPALSLLTDADMRLNVARALRNPQRVRARANAALAIEPFNTNQSGTILSARIATIRPGVA